MLGLCARVAQRHAGAARTPPPSRRGACRACRGRPRRSRRTADPRRCRSSGSRRRRPGADRARARRPSRLSCARRKPSVVWPLITRPPAVTSTPDRLGRPCSNSVNGMRSGVAAERHAPEDLARVEREGAHQSPRRRRAGRPERAEHGLAHHAVGRAVHRRELAQPDQAPTLGLLALEVGARDQAHLHGKIRRVEERDAPAADRSRGCPSSRRRRGRDRRACRAGSAA